MAAFLRIPIRGCLPKGRATHSPRYVVMPGLFLPCDTEEAIRLSGAGTHKMPLLAASPAAPAAVSPSEVRRYVTKAKDNVTKLTTAIAVACLIILIPFILLITKMYQYYQIIKRISKENLHLDLDPLQSYDDLETNDI